MMQTSQSRAEIEAWLIREISERLKIPIEEVDIAAELTQFGLDSAEGVSLMAGLETWLDRELSPTLVWDYPTIRSMAGYLARE